MSSLFAIHGADSKVGVSMLSQSLAELISTGNRNVRVLLVNLQGRFGASYTSYVGENIEGMRHYLDNQLLNKEELLAGCRCSDNLYVIGGVSSLGCERDYQPEMSAYLLSLVKDEFDLILADCGSDVDNGLALGALIMADERVLVLTQNESVLKRCEKLDALYRALKLDFSIAVCNRYLHDDPHTRGYLEKRLGIAGENLWIVGESQEGRRAEAKERTLLACGDSRFEEELRELANGILKRAGLEPIKKQRKKRWRSFI